LKLRQDEVRYNLILMRQYEDSYVHCSIARKDDTIYGCQRHNMCWKDVPQILEYVPPAVPLPFLSHHIIFIHIDLGFALSFQTTCHCLFNFTLLSSNLLVFIIFIFSNFPFFFIFYFKYFTFFSFFFNLTVLIIFLIFLFFSFNYLFFSFRYLSLFFKIYQLSYFFEFIIIFLLILLVIKIILIVVF